MGLFKLFTSIFKATPPDTPAPAPLPQERPTEAVPTTVSFSDIGASLPVVSDAEVAEAAARYQFVLHHQLPPLATEDRWWEETSHKRWLQEGSEKALSWLSPFVAPEVATSLAPEQALNPWGPLGSNKLAKVFRAVIRERRKLKEPYIDVLQALYGTCVLSDLMESLEFEGFPARSMAQYVSLSELQTVQLNYASMGYLCIESLGKTDIKWLVEAFGEPAEHQAFNTAWPAIRQNAISRKCWEDLASENRARTFLDEPTHLMQQWLLEKVRRNIGYYKEWQARVASKQVRDAESSMGIEKALEATSGEFVVADLETTGLNSNEHGILEFAALQVNAQGLIQAEMSVLVALGHLVPSEITALTGISNEEVALEGIPLAEALDKFLKFVGDRPVFFHNAPFDKGFLSKSAAQTGRQIQNPVHDTLPLARKAWPELGGYQLKALASHVGAPEPSHRALSDSRSTLAVLLAARDKLSA